MSSSENSGPARAGLDRPSRDRLTEHWSEYLGAAPPPRTSRSLMIRAVAYKMQERVIGGLSAATRRLLCAEKPAPVRRRRGLRPGTVLIREWHGVAHQVTIVGQGGIYRGGHHPSRSGGARLST